MPTEFSVEVTRHIAAPRERVYRAFLDTHLLQQWMCPDDCAVSHAAVDEREGGRHRVEFLDRDGGRHAFDSVIRELVPGERIVFDWVFENLDLPARTEQSLLTIELRDNAAGTTDLTLIHARLLETDVHGRENVTEGWSQALDHLVALFERSRP